MFISVTGGTPPYNVTYGDMNNQTVVVISGNGSVILPATNIGTTTYYVFSVTDSNGSTITPNTEFIVNVQPVPNIVLTTTQDACGATICASGAQAYVVSGGMGTMTGLCQPFVPPVGTTTYTVTGTSGSCTGSAQTSITFNGAPPFSNPPVALIDSAYCSDGSISLSLPNQAPFSVSWANLGSSSPYLTGLAPGTYYATVSDTNGCLFHGSYYVPQGLMPADCGVIRGSVIYDMDRNCMEGSGDIPAAFSAVRANPGNHVTFIDQNGNYEFHLNAGNYTIEQVVSQQNTGPFCTSSYQVSLGAGQLVDDIDFLDTVANLVDLQITAYAGQIRPGFSFWLSPVISNLLPWYGLDNVSGWFTLPAGVTMQSWSYPHTVSNDTVYFHASSAGNFYAQIPFYAGGVQLGDTVTFCAGVTASGPEENLANNTFCTLSIVVGSFDPNDKTTFVQGAPTHSSITMEDQVLDYVIRFQNTGTADAINVTVLDTIQGTLDLSSLQLLATSHTCRLSVMEDRILKFDFPFIHLPDSTTDEPGSHGFIHYRIRQSASNAVGTEIRNTAYIYFDFNEAVITNTTHDLIVAPLGMEEHAQEQSIDLYPNPSDGMLHIRAGSDIRAIRVLGMNGQQVFGQQVQGGKEAEADLSRCSKGIYLVQVETAHGVAVRRVVKK